MGGLKKLKILFPRGDFNRKTVWPGGFKHPLAKKLFPQAPLNITSQNISRSTPPQKKNHPGLNTPH